LSFIDLIRMSLGSLWRRKLRTSLTMLGVAIGTTSIVVMVSLGIGINYNYLQSVEESGSLTQINISYYDDSFYSVGTKNSSSSEDTEKKRLNDSAIEEIAGFDHVKVASPRLSFYVQGWIGAYQGGYSITGMSMDAIRELKLPITEGALPGGGETLQLIVGHEMRESFSKGNEDWEDLEEFYANGTWYDIDFMHKPILTIFDTDTYYSLLYGEGEGLKMPKKYALETCATFDSGTDYSYYALADIEALKTELKKVFKNKVVPGQPTGANGKPLKEWVYNEAVVFVDDMNEVENVQQEIRAMGFDCYSSMDWIKSMQEESRTIQAVLGAIGAVSLLVAAIGITNTMMMSIYERTKEIGVIKVLGCSLRNIRGLFLMEAAYIGLFGGLVGLAGSYGISWLLNRFLAQTIQGDASAVISVVPIWLSTAGLTISVCIALLAGFAPAVRAMKLSPLAAIRSE